MTSRSARLTAGTMLVAVALTGAAACSSGDQAPAAPTPDAVAPPNPGNAAGQPTDATRQAFGQANQGALALVALGGLGTDKGVGEQVQGLAPGVTSQGQALLDQVKQAATAQGVALGDQLDAQAQAVVTDLQSRSGRPFDAAWLQAATSVIDQARAAADAVLNDPNASPEAKTAARNALAKLDELAAQVRSASSSAGASTPGSVNAGTGGQAASSAESAPVLPLAVSGLGIVLIGGAAAWTRRSRSDA
jgi:predicted outer membrane protein